MPESTAGGPRRTSPSICPGIVPRIPPRCDSGARGRARVLARAERIGDYLPGPAIIGEWRAADDGRCRARRSAAQPTGWRCGRDSVAQPLPIPPAGRVEFIRKGLPEGVKAAFITRRVDTGPAGENDPTRPLAALEARADVPEPSARPPLNPAGGASARRKRRSESTCCRDGPTLARGRRPARTRKLYFSEQAERPNDPSSPTKFYITVEGATLALV